MNSLVGLDIGSHTTKLIELTKNGSEYSLSAAGSMPTPPKSGTAGTQVDLEAVSYVVRQLIKETGVKTTDVNVALPESQVFTRVISMPQLSTKELASSIQWEAEQYIPLPLDQVNLDYVILRGADNSKTGKMDVLLVAAPKSLIQRYMTILDMVELNAVAAETEIIASTRALTRSVPANKNILIISIGAQSTDLAIVRGGILAFTRSISAGGDAMTRAITQTFEFSVLQAEEYKKTYGLKAEILEGKLARAIAPIMDTVVSEMKRAIAFFEETYKDERIDVILLSGGSAKLPGLVPFIAQTSGKETQMANPWVGITKDIRFSVLNNEGCVFSVAVGLALR